MNVSKNCLLVAVWALESLTRLSVGNFDNITVSVLLTCVSHSAACAGFAGESYFISASSGNLGTLYSCHRAVARFCAFSSLCNRRFSPVCCPKWWADLGILPQQDEPENQQLDKVSRAFSVFSWTAFAFAEVSQPSICDPLLLHFYCLIWLLLSVPFI